MNNDSVFFETDPVDTEWYERLTKKGWSFDSEFHDPELEKLKRVILQYGGLAVVLPSKHPYLDKILERGIILDGSTARKGIGRSNDCHGNVARNYRRFCYKIMNGFGLHQDGVWRVHSWNLKNGSIIETTVEWVAYFGFEMNDTEAEEFASENA